MCGITGAVATPPGRIPDRSVAERMCRVIAHRGPDDEGILHEGNVFLGMRRLSIIDLEGGHQPMTNEDSTVFVVLNGEIYNFQELRGDLQKKGHTFVTHSDTECIVHAYEEFGEGCFERLRGMFAVAIWDAKRRRLVLGRDRLGKKPLYYAEWNSLLVFGSELKSLLQIPGLPAEVEPASVRDFLALGYVPTPASIFRGIRKLPPGHYLVHQDGSTAVRSYWSLPFEPKWTEGEDALGERLLELLDESVRIRLMSDVPFGAFLSGGLDSSVVVALMARNMSLPVKTFTMGFAEEGFDEVGDARRVAARVGADHRDLVVKADAVSLLQDLVWYLDEPFADSSAIPTFLVSKLAREHVKMVLSGDGGDELFAGYDRYARYRVLDRFSPLGGGVSALGSLLPDPLGKRLAAVGRRMAQPYPERYLSGVALATDDLVFELLGASGDGRGLFASVRGDFLRGDVASRSDQILAGDIATYLLDDILVKVDRMSMASSLEARAPLLDHRLVEFAARLPWSLKFRGGRGKYLLRKVASRLLPSEVLEKPKQGFAIPLARWFRSELREMVQDLLASRAFRERGVFHPKAAKKVLADHLRGAADHGEHLWQILTFELWARRFLDARAA